jgi:iron complex transport system permease protein
VTALTVASSTRRVQRRAATRTTIVTAGVVVALAVAFCVSISVGDFPIPLRDVVPAIFGAGDEQSEFIVRTLRLPRAITAVLVGAAFGLSGAIFQSPVRRPCSASSCSTRRPA